MGSLGGTLGLVTYQEGGHPDLQPVLSGSLPRKPFDYLIKPSADFPPSFRYWFLSPFEIFKNSSNE